MFNRIYLGETPINKIYEGNKNIINVSKNLVINPNDYIEMNIPQTPQDGNRNLVLESDVVKESSVYKAATYNLSTPLKVKQTYTISIYGVIAPEGQKFGLWYKTPDGGRQCYLEYDKERNVHYATWTPTKFTNDGDPYLIEIYNTPRETSGINATITKIKIEEGDQITPWSKAPEDNHRANSITKRFECDFDTMNRNKTKNFEMSLQVNIKNVKSMYYSPGKPIRIGAEVVLHYSDGILAFPGKYIGPSYETYMYTNTNARVYAIFNIKQDVPLKKVEFVLVIQGVEYGEVRVSNPLLTMVPHTQSLEELI